MKITDTYKNISSCFMTAALMLIAIEPAIHKEWLSYITAGGILSLLILSGIRKENPDKTGKSTLLPGQKDDIKGCIYNITACITGITVALSEESKMLYAWILLFSMYFLCILLTAITNNGKSTDKRSEDL